MKKKAWENKTYIEGWEELFRIIPKSIFER